VCGWINRASPKTEFVHSKQSDQPANASALKWQPSKEIQNALPREGTAALPYAEFVNESNIKSNKPVRQRERIEMATIEKGFDQLMNH